MDALHSERRTLSLLDNTLTYNRRVQFGTDSTHHLIFYLRLQAVRVIHVDQRKAHRRSVHRDSGCRNRCPNFYHYRCSVSQHPSLRNCLYQQLSIAQHLRFGVSSSCSSVLDTYNLGTLSSNLQCLCTNTQFGQAATQCIQTNCTPAERTEALQLQVAECAGK